MGYSPKLKGRKTVTLFLYPAASSLVLHPAMFEHLSHYNSDLSLTRLSTYCICFYCLRACVFSCVRFFVAWWTVARQAPLSMEFSRQEYWSGMLFPSLRDLPDPGVEPRSPALQADSLLSESPGKLMRGEQDRKQVRGCKSMLIPAWANTSCLRKEI